MQTLFPTLPSDARVWLFATDGSLPDSALAAVRGWLPSWASHGRPVTAEADVLADCVLVVAAVISTEEMNAGVSGCGIDAMTHAVETALAGANLYQLPALSVAYRDAENAWQVVPRPAFRRLANGGQVDGTTQVLDLTATDLGTLRASGVERPAAEAWHGRTFGLAVAA
ncbi:MAG: hypothetical protein AAGI52_05765 [Bacteroidota bacterium]